MIWIICALLTALLIVLSIRGFLSKKGGSLRMVYIVGYLFAATFTIYIPYFFTGYNFLFALIGNATHVLRVVTIDADVTQLYDAIMTGVGSPVLSGIYVMLAGLLHVALPAVSALTAVTVLFRCFSSLQLVLAGRCKKPMFVFSEVNERSLQLAKSLEQLKCHIVFAGTSDEVLSGENDSKRGYIFKEETISQLKLRMKKGKDIYFFCISEDEDESLSYCLQLIEKYAAEDEALQPNLHIFQFSRHQDFAVYMDSANKGSLDIQCINEYELLIYDLLDQYPMMHYAKDSIHVLLYGLSQINIIALRAIAWCGQLSGFPVKVSVVGIGIQEKADALKVRFPGLFTERYTINIYNRSTEKEVLDTIGQYCSDATYIIVSGQNDNETMEQGIMLRRLFYKLDPAFSNAPPIFCYIKEASKFNILKNLATAESNPKRKMSYELTPFGSLKDIYTYKHIIDSDLEKLAKNVHLAYEEIFSDGPINVEEALKRYNVFEVNKRSNRANALHIRYKLHLLGLDYTDDPQAEEVVLSDYYNDESIDRMSRAEHDRWMAFLETEGWIPSTKADVEAYRGSGISKGRHNCPILKMHPYICPYEDLEELSLDLEGKDTTVYDMELILRIPDILGNKWNVANTKYKIIKRR